jgi:hypothetical protein
LKQIKFNPNNPSLWKDFDPSETAEEFVGNKSEATIRRSISASDKRDNIVFKETMKQVAAERDEVYHEKRKQGLAQRDNSYQAECNARPEVRAKISSKLKGKEKSAEHEAKVAAKNRERSKPIQTPYGQFESRKAAAEHMTSIGIGNAGKKLDKFLKTDSTNYFYI